MEIKERMVDIGKRMWNREYTDGNGGNLTVRVGDNLVLCTPTLVSKGFMAVGHMCLVNMDGVQLAGIQPPTCMIPEAEVFLGQIGMAEYRTPGSPDKADVVGTAAVDHMAVLMVNHGVITWGKDIEDSYWKMWSPTARHYRSHRG